MRSLRPLFALLALTIAACGGDGYDMIKRFTPADADARARATLAQLAARHSDSIEARLAPSVDRDYGHVALQKLDSLLGGQRFDTIRVIGAQTSTNGVTRHVNLSYELHSEMGWTLANVATVDSAGDWAIEGISARPIERTLENETAFSLRGKSATHWLWLAMTIACAGLALGTAIFLATRRAMPKRWRWVLFSLVGVGAASLDWASGATTFRLINLQVPSASALRAGPAAPWILTFAFPVGAIAAIEHYRRWRRRRDVERETAVLEEPVAG